MLRVQAPAEAFAASKQTPARRSINPQPLPKSMGFATRVPELDPPGLGDRPRRERLLGHRLSGHPRWEPGVWLCPRSLSAQARAGAAD